MKKLHRVYELLLDYSNITQLVENITIGLVWTACQIKQADLNILGLAMSPAIATRTLPWSGTLVGRPLNELAQWILEWDSYKATVGMSAINCSIQARQKVGLYQLLNSGNLAVFDYFLPQLIGKKVVVIGHYPNLERYQDKLDLSIIERVPQLNDYPDSACEYLLPNADWVFITGSSLTNKTFPRLAQLSHNATTVLMGPTVPFLREFKEFGIDYLAGIIIEDSLKVSQTINEGGGVRIFDNGARYYVANLNND